MDNMNTSTSVPTLSARLADISASLLRVAFSGLMLMGVILSAILLLVFCGVLLRGGILLFGILNDAMMWKS